DLRDGTSVAKDEKAQLTVYGEGWIRGDHILRKPAPVVAISAKDMSPGIVRRIPRPAAPITVNQNHATLVGEPFQSAAAYPIAHWNIGHAAPCTRAAGKLVYARTVIMSIIMSAGCWIDRVMVICVSSVTIESLRPSGPRICRL